MKVIRCKSGKAFAMCNENFLDAEWKIDERFYISLGCTSTIEESAKFESCDCEHCEKLREILKNR